MCDSAPPSYYSHLSYSNKNTNDEFKTIIERHEISPYFAAKLRKLEEYDVTFICDDSSSMSSPIIDTNNPFGPSRTRWDELKETVSTIMEIACLLDHDGIDIHFLNRRPLTGKKTTKKTRPLYSLNVKKKKYIY
jgi:hypothetical protein